MGSPSDRHGSIPVQSHRKGQAEPIVLTLQIGLIQMDQDGLRMVVFDHDNRAIMGFPNCLRRIGGQLMHVDGLHSGCRVCVRRRVAFQHISMSLIDFDYSPPLVCGDSKLGGVRTDLYQRVPFRAAAKDVPNGSDMDLPQPEDPGVEALAEAGLDPKNQTPIKTVVSICSSEALPQTDEA